MAHLPKGQGIFLPPFKAWLASNIPAVYDNTMSYYEELVALIKYLQDIVVPAVNDNATAVTVISEAQETLQAYVDNYFDNLDVQEEINNKLDQMAEDGTLQEIITQYLQSNVAWTFDNVAEMKQSENLVNGSYARTLGFYSIGDNGGSLYKITNTGTANEMDKIAVGNLIAELVVDNEINPKQLGAKTDGTTDDAPFIRRCFEILDGGVINLLDGYTYLLNSLAPAQDYFFALKDKVSIHGKSTLKIANNFGDYNFVFKAVSSLSDISLKYFTIDENSTNNSLTANTGNEGYLRTTFRLLAHDGISINNLTFDKVVFNDCAGVWQIELEGDAKNVNIADCIINYTSTLSPSYDRTSIYFGVTDGTVSGCTLNGNGKANTAFESHGINNYFVNNIIDGYHNGVFIVNDPNDSTANNKNQIVHDNTIDVDRVGVYIWSSFAGQQSDNIEIYNNTIRVKTGTTGDNIVGIGLYDVMGEGAVIDVLNIYNNTILSANTYLRPLRFLSSIANTSAINSLIVENNTIKGSAKECIYINSPAGSKLSINKAIFRGNVFNISTTIEYAIFMIPRSNISHVHFINNDFANVSFTTQLIQIFGSADNALDIRLIDNTLPDIAINKYVNASDANVKPLVIERFDNLNLFTANTPAYINNLQVKNQSVISDTIKTCKKVNNTWCVEWNAATMPTHTPVLKGMTFNLSNDSTYLKRIGKKLGFIADHNASTGNHQIGDWVLEGLYVYQAKTVNNITSDLGTHTSDFTYVGENATFTDISI